MVLYIALSLLLSSVCFSIPIGSSWFNVVIIIIIGKLEIIENFTLHWPGAGNEFSLCHHHHHHRRRSVCVLYITALHCVALYWIVYMLCYVEWLFHLTIQLHCELFQQLITSYTICTIYTEVISSWAAASIIITSLDGLDVSFMQHTRRQMAPSSSTILWTYLPLLPEEAKITHTHTNKYRIPIEEAHYFPTHPNESSKGNYFILNFLCKTQRPYITCTHDNWQPSMLDYCN